MRKRRPISPHCMISKRFKKLVTRCSLRTPPTVSLNAWGQGTQAYNGARIDAQQLCFSGYDLSRRWYKIDWADTHDAQAQGAHGVPGYE